MNNPHCDHVFKPIPSADDPDPIPISCYLHPRHGGRFHTDGVSAFVTPFDGFVYEVSPSKDPGARLRSAVAEVDQHLAAAQDNDDLATASGLLRAKADLLIALATLERTTP